MSKKWKISIWVLATVFTLLAAISGMVGNPNNVIFSSEEDLKFTRDKKKSEEDLQFTRDKKEIPSSVDKALREMELANIVFNTPSILNIDDASQVDLVLSLGDTIEQLKELISEAGKKYGATIKVSNRMEARLSGYSFQITAITPEIQAVSKEQPTNWKWEIQPKKEGLHNLHLTLTALLDVDGHNTPRSIRTFDKEIEVTVTVSQKAKLFFTSNWQWLWAAILVPFVGWYWKKRSKNNDKS